MKNYRTIFEEIKSNAAAIEAARVEIDKLSFKEERMELVKNSETIAKYKELKAQAEKNAGKIAELSEKIYLLNVENLILTDNLQAAIFAEALPVIREAFKKYEGKQYGPKTAAAIKEEVKKAGFLFYIDGRSRQDTLVINVMNPENMCNDYRFPDVKVFANYEKPFLSGNKISFAEAETTSPVYIEDTKSRAAEIIEAYNKYYAAREAADKARNELNKIMPAGRYYNGTETVYKTIF